MSLANTNTADIKVSVMITTYNHEAFIAQAIESVLMQKVDFDYEIVIGEDCSTDHTREIVVDYARRYPDRIRPLLQKKNMGGSAGMNNFLSVIQSCVGQYIAMLEGDDFWTDPCKLQKQVDFLDAHPDYSISSHNINLMYETELSDQEWLGRDHPVDLTLEDLLSKGSGGATCSLVFRKDAFFPFPDWYPRQKGGDWSLQILCASKGKMRYFPEVMGVYRRHDKGAAHNAILNEKGSDKIALPSRNSLSICNTLDKHFDGRYSKEINHQRAYWYWVGAVDYLPFRKVKAWEYALRALRLIPSKDWNNLPNFTRAFGAIFLGKLPDKFKSIVKYPRRLIRVAKHLIHLMFMLLFFL
jgi:glycosyltransferase involved in cell wall biosynthesis